LTNPFVMPGVSHVGPGALGSLDNELQRLSVRRVVVISDPGVMEAGLVQRVLNILDKGGYRYETFSEVQLEPDTENVEEAARVVRAGKHEAVIGVGGGSSLDVAKGAAVLATGGSIESYIGVERISTPGLPTVLIPTTAGTGAEVTLNAIYKLKREQVKKGVVSRHLRASAAIVDPELTLSCPPKITAASGMDALIHATESYTSVNATVHTDMYAIKAIRLIGRSLRRAVALGSDMKARTDMAWGSYLAGISLANAGVGAVHALAYPLGGRFNVSHGVSNSLLLPYVLGFNIIGAVEKFKDVAVALDEPIEGKSPIDAAFAVRDHITRLGHDIGLPKRLSEVGVTEKDVDDLTDGAMGQTRLLANNPRVMTRQDISAIYREAL